MDKRTKKKVVRVAKKHTGAVIAIAVILVVIIAVGVLLYFKVDSVHNAIDSLFKKNTNVTYGDKDLSFHFLELGNHYTGDCTYIKAGDIDILIDAGSREKSATTIEAYVDKYCTDGKLEYVIATHGHQDHIAGFVDTGSSQGIFSHYECETIIDFALTNNVGSKESAIHKKYVAARDAEVAAGAKHYTALECAKESTEGAKRVYSLGEGMSMTILYQKFYEEKTSDENDYSVCVLFTHGDKNYLFTGDLEKEGEASLVEKNSLPQVALFKGGHHGSYTASTDTLLSVIKPEIVCVCCCAGSTEYTDTPANTFPSQTFVDNVSKYTDCVYVTTRIATEAEETETGKKYVSFNGNIVVVSSAGTVTVNCSNNNTKLKDSDWFKANRTCPAAWST